MRDVMQGAEVRGRVKYKGTGASSGEYKTGRLEVELDKSQWRINIWVVSKRDKPIATFRLSQSAIKNIIKRHDRVILDLSSGTNIYLQTDLKEEKNLLLFQQLLADIRDGKAEQENESKAEVGLSQRSRSLSESSVTASPECSPKFTSVKENKRMNGTDTDLSYDDSYVLKENYNSGPSHSPDHYLKKGQEKSQDTLKAFRTKGFYSSTPASHKVYSRTSETAGSVKRPGLMPLNPTPQKRPRLLSDLNYSWGRQINQDSKQQQQSLLGFSNLGNTCYMNAILQSLFALNPFSNDVLNSFKKRGRSFSPASLYCSLAKLLKIRKRAGCPDSNKRELLRNVKSAISATAKRFSGYQQHDAHEFLCQVLDQLKEEIVKFNKSTPSPTRDPTETADVVNATVDNFEFEVLHTITCVKCEEEVAKAEQFNDLSLDMPLRSFQDYPKSLQDSLDTFLQAEEIDYTCPKCGHLKSKVRHKFTRLPRILILHLKRYTYSTGNSQQGKVGQRIFIPSHITLSSHIDSEAQRPPPVPCVIVNASPIKSQTESDDFKGENSRRKLDYGTSNGSKYNFKPFSSIKSTDDSVVLLPEKEQSATSEPDDNKLFPSFSLDETNEEADMARAIELSLQEAQKHDQDQTEEEHKEEPEPPVNGTFTERDLQAMSEEQRIEMAIQQSLMDSQDQTGMSYPSSNTSSLSTSSIVKECSRAYLETDTIAAELPVFKTKCRTQSDPNVGEGFDKVDGAVMAQILSDNDEEMFGSEIFTSRPSDSVTENQSKKSETLTQSEIDYIFEGDKQKLHKHENVLVKPEPVESETGKSHEEIDLTCSEEKENLKPETKQPPVVKEQPILRPTSDEIKHIKQKRAEIESGTLPFSYRLVSIVNHIGHSSSAGHYISDVYDMKKKAWLSFDDAQVSKLPETEIKLRRERSGYIFFYMCKEVFEEMESLHTAISLTKEIAECKE